MVYRRRYRKYPYRKIYKKRRYTRRFKRYRRGGVKRTPLGNGFANSHLAKLRYVDTKTFTYNADGTMALHNFRCNSIQDPDYTGVGHQPLGHDEWQLIYKRYIVVGSKIHLQIQAMSDDNLVYPVTIGVQLTNNGTVAGNMNTTLENKRCSFVNVCQQPGMKAYNINKTFSTKKFFGINDIRDNMDDFGAEFGESPTEDAFFTVFYGSTSGAALPEAKTVVVQVTIDYIVLMTDPIGLGAS